MADKKSGTNLSGNRRIRTKGRCTLHELHLPFLKFALHKLRVPVDRFLNDILAVWGEMLPCVPVKFFWINRLSVFDDDMRFADARELVFKNRGSIVEADWYDGAACLVRNLKGTLLKREKAQFLACISRPFRENTDGDPGFYMFDSCKDCLQPFFRIIAVQEKTVKEFHPCGKKRDVFHFLFCDITRQVPASGISQQNIEKASVVADEQDRFIRYAFFSDDSDGYAGHFQNTLKCPLYDAERGDIPFSAAEFPDDPFHEKDRNGKNEEQNKKYDDTYKTKHTLISFLYYMIRCKDAVISAILIIIHQKGKKRNYVLSFFGQHMCMMIRRKPGGDCPWQGSAKDFV